MMGVEIERKFLVTNDSFRPLIAKTIAMEQGYFRAEDATIRVRIAGPKAYLTIKGRTSGISRAEFEYEIPQQDALSLLEHFCGTRRLKKKRHVLRHEGHEWVVDEFEGRHAGLRMAEIELQSEEEPFARPSFLGEEVSGDMRYFNESLAGLAKNDVSTDWKL